MSNFSIFYNDQFSTHLVPIGHPERPDRIISLNKMIKENFQKFTINIEEFDVENEILLVHTEKYLKNINSIYTNNKILKLDEDTYFSRGTLKAAKLGVCGVLKAVDHVMSKNYNKAFVCSRPPGHHAEPNKAMGFCIFSNAAIAAEYALKKYNLKRVAVLDFDVHHGNGTQAAFLNKPKLIYASTHEMPLFPGTGYKEEKGVDNIFNFPLNACTESKEFLSNWKDVLIPKINEVNPDLLVISSGFDAHKDDPLSSVKLNSVDYKYITDLIVNLSNTCCNGKLISLLEGGYELNSLKESVKYHLDSLIK